MYILHSFQCDFLDCAFILLEWEGSHWNLELWGPALLQTHCMLQSKHHGEKGNEKSVVKLILLKVNSGILKVNVNIEEPSGFLVEIQMIPRQTLA